jgi:hypothetical protein
VVLHGVVLDVCCVRRSAAHAGDASRESEQHSLQGRVPGGWGAHLANSAATAFSDSPTYLENSSGPLTARKFAPASPATALPVAQEAGASRQKLVGLQSSESWTSCMV